MKYIRTKDGKILSLNEFKYEKKYHWYSPNEKYLSRVDIGFTCWRWCFEDEYDLIPEVLGKIVVEKIKREECKFADTIEELCDRVVVKDFNNKEPRAYNPNKGNWKEIADTLFNARKVEWVKFAIWTDKGLIYIAKMNEKGEIGLL